MRLTLDDEQERCLRDWFHMDDTNSWAPPDRGKGLRLAQAIAPLMMQEWKMEACEFGWTLSNGRMEVYVSPRDGDHVQRQETAERIHRLLNADERKESR